MNSPYLTEDCINHILKYLQYHHSTLFNCILVNRFWCRAAIPLLYADPFVRTNKKDYLIILTLITCFNKEEISRLNNKIKLIDIEYEPLFKYTKYVKNYYSDRVNSKITKWIEHQHSNIQDKIPKNIYSSFHQLILNHCVNIEQINISIDLVIKSNPEFNIPASNLTKLNSLTLNNLSYLNQEIGKEFLSNIEVHCLNLKELSISSGTWFGIIVPVIMEKLCAIIQKQNNLGGFKVLHSLLNNDNIIFLSLENQKHSLVSIEFSYINFSNISFKNFINLCNLNYLKFHKCYDSTNQLVRYEILKFASFKLKKLAFYSNDWNKNIESTMIKYLGASLQSLSICERSITFRIIQNISIYCLNLLTLETTIIGNIDNVEISYFKNLKVRSLDFRIFFYDDMSVEHLARLANNISINVKEIFFTPFSNVQLWLKIFLENCHNYLEKISLKTSLTDFEEFFNIILNYVKKSNNSLKILSIVCVSRILNNEESRLLDEIRMKGVTIVIDF
ncbi:hypothetical protein RclHR1_08650006 [Rhizophagus clarus]|uniref:F-box domain-containing protein n=1 Tax=Rhizophagus clarus TaxID=94130 RepID=A0A2Z6S7Z9_9GLOM|nr:hypothetical protein RclHR1_08650006 [Rhizophagus clarus]GES75698.1 hypothetical protein GLOIN_2v1791592 [Rhizophagus clarus]